MKARQNPLRVARVERVLRFDPGWLGTDWSAIFRRLEQLEWRGAVVGPHGSGKTTMLDSLAERLEERGQCVHRLRLGVGRGLDEDSREALLAALARGEFVLLDGAEQLGPWAWHRIRRAADAAAGLVVTSHRRGRLPLLLATSTTPQTLERCLSKLLGPGALPFSGEQIRAMWKRHGGNVREALWEAYDLL